MDVLVKIGVVGNYNESKIVLHAGKLYIRTLLPWVSSSVSRVASDKD